MQFLSNLLSGRECQLLLSDLKIYFVVGYVHHVNICENELFVTGMHFEASTKEIERGVHEKKT